MTENLQRLTFLYRGPLSFCNYSCEYCPLTKTEFDPKILDQDKMELAKFVGHIGQNRYPELTIAFIPWGEALVYEHYWEAIIRLSQLPSVRMVVIQTNLSVVPDWVQFGDSEKVSFWCSFHPTQTTVDGFLDRAAVLDSHSVAYCVGAVGHDEYYDTYQTLREKLSRDKYLWVNPLNDDIEAYCDADVEKWSKIDPLFPLVTRNRFTKGTACRCGKSVFTIGEKGEMRRCPFTKRVIGNLYETDVPSVSEPCPNEQCNCFIGYIHWENESFRMKYGNNPIQRIASITATCTFSSCQLMVE